MTPNADQHGNPEPSGKSERPIDSQLSPALDVAYYDRLASVYFERHEQLIQQYTTRVECRWLEKMIPESSDVLIVGVGGGREIQSLLARNSRIVAVDYSQEMLHLGKSHWPQEKIRWVHADAHDLRQFAGSFDRVVCLAAVNYFYDVELAIRNILSALRPGGKMIVSCINPLHPSEAKAQPSSSSVTRNLFSPAAFCEIVEGAGGMVKEVRGLRIWADRLPVKWNRPDASAYKRLILRFVLELEPLLRRLTAPEKAKFFWTIADRQPC